MSFIIESRGSYAKDFSDWLAKPTYAIDEKTKAVQLDKDDKEVLASGVSAFFGRHVVARVGALALPIFAAIDIVYRTLAAASHLVLGSLTFVYNLCVTNKSETFTLTNSAEHVAKVVLSLLIGTVGAVATLVTPSYTNSAINTVWNNVTQNPKLTVEDILKNAAEALKAAEKNVGENETAVKDAQTKLDEAQTKKVGAETANVAAKAEDEKKAAAENLVKETEAHKAAETALADAKKALQAAITARDEAKKSVDAATKAVDDKVAAEKKATEAKK